MIIHLFIISSAVQIYEFSYIHYQCTIESADCQQKPQNNCKNAHEQATVACGIASGFTEKS